MEVEDFATTLERRLTDRNEESPVHRKAAAVLASLMHATRTVQNTSCRFPTLLLFIQATPKLSRFTWLVDRSN